MLKDDIKNSVNQNIIGDGNVMSSNDTSITGDSKKQIQELKKKDQEIERLKNK